MEGADQVRMEATLTSLQDPFEGRFAAQLQQRAAESWQRPGHPGWSIWAMDSEAFVGELKSQHGRVHIVVPVPPTSHSRSSMLPPGKVPLFHWISNLTAQSLPVKNGVRASLSLPVMCQSSAVDHKLNSRVESIEWPAVAFWNTGQRSVLVETWLMHSVPSMLGNMLLHSHSECICFQPLDLLTDKWHLYMQICLRCQSHWLAFPWTLPRRRTYYPTPWAVSRLRSQSRQVPRSCPGSAWQLSWASAPKASPLPHPCRGGPLATLPCPRQGPPTDPLNLAWRPKVQPPSNRFELISMLVLS